MAWAMLDLHADGRRGRRRRARGAPPERGASSTCASRRSTRTATCRARSTCRRRSWPPRLDELPRDRPIYMICQGGFRSLRAAQFLQPGRLRAGRQRRRRDRGLGERRQAARLRRHDRAEAEGRRVGVDARWRHGLGLGHYHLGGPSNVPAHLDVRSRPRGGIRPRCSSVEVSRHEVRHTGPTEGRSDRMSLADPPLRRPAAPSSSSSRPTRSWPSPSARARSRSTSPASSSATRRSAARSTRSSRSTQSAIRRSTAWR